MSNITNDKIKFWSEMKILEQRKFFFKYLKFFLFHKHSNFSLLMTIICFVGFLISFYYVIRFVFQNSEYYYLSIFIAGSFELLALLFFSNVSANRSEVYLQQKNIFDKAEQKMSDRTVFRIYCFDSYLTKSNVENDDLKEFINQRLECIKNSFLCFKDANGFVNLIFGNQFNLLLISTLIAVLLTILAFKVIEYDNQIFYLNDLVGKEYWDDELSVYFEICSVINNKNFFLSLVIDSLWGIFILLSLFMFSSWSLDFGRYLDRNQTNLVKNSSLLTTYEKLSIIFKE